MSSHHIIRENQEPALFIADYFSLSTEHLGQLLEWSPTLLALASQYDFLQSAGIKVDVLLAPSETIIDDLEEHTEIIYYGNSYWQTLFTYLQEKKNVNLHILSQELDFKALEPWLELFTINVLRGNRKVLFQKEYHKWLPKGFRLEILNQDESLVSGSNLHYLGDARFEVLTDGFVKIAKQLDYLVISEEL
ncbi:hypothetical protein ACFRAE_05240 [Sphingobacterium sp. HJSM2_6]|uniref:hypothetical protein n=1 Tax=Sphingobacterium sp. HJSM2_6 TaxID=3366264 RepID=UPI003BEE4238